MVYFISLFNLIRHFIFIVKSSSLDRVEEEVGFKLGLMQTGGTGRSCTMKEFILVLPATFMRSHYLLGMLFKM